MKLSSPLLEDAVQAFSSLPGIGRRTAIRLVLHLLRTDADATERLVGPLAKMRSQIRFCSQCQYVTEAEICEICSDLRRDRSLICVVESIRDVMAIENTAQFRGLFHVLGGLISPLDGIGPDELNIEPLMARLDGVAEVIMAVSPTHEGETTIYYLGRLLAERNIKVSIIARGVAFGGELEYADEVTLGRSIASRQPYATDPLK
jgi:recombination protein RecR